MERLKETPVRGRRTGNADAARYFGALGVTNVLVGVEAGTGITPAETAGEAYCVDGSHEAGPLRVEFLATKNTKEHKAESSLFTNSQCSPIDNTNTNVANVEVLPMPVSNVANAGQDWKWIWILATFAHWQHYQTALLPM